MAAQQVSIMLLLSSATPKPVMVVMMVMIVMMSLAPIPNLSLPLDATSPSGGTRVMTMVVACSRTPMVMRTTGRFKTLGAQAGATRALSSSKLQKVKVCVA